MPRPLDATPRTTRSTLRLILAALTLVAAACTDQPLPTTPSPASQPPRAFPRGPNATTGPGVDRRVSAIQISVNHLTHACVLESDNQVICWGSTTAIPFSRYPGPYTWVAAGGGGWADCGILVNGTIHCFRGSTTPPAGTFTRLSLGVGHGCGIRTDETVACWGDNEFGKATPPAGTFKDIDAGDDNTCGIHTDGTHECWGKPQSSDIDPDSDNSVPSWGGNYTKVSAGKAHTCAIRAGTGGVSCGGSNSNGQTDGTIFSAIDVSAGSFHTCAISAAFLAYCWGFDAADETEPPSGQYTSIAAGEYFTCGITLAGNARCWGSRNYNMHSVPYEIADTQTTETSIDIDPSPSTFGAGVAVIATVTVPARIAEDGDQAEVPTTGRVMFIDGGTCESPTTVLDAGVAITPRGTAKFSTTSLSVGTHDIGACYLGGDGLSASGDGASLDITAAPTSTAITVSPSSQQYSDRVTLEAAITPASVNGIAAAGSVQFTIDGALVGGGPVLVSNGKATLPNVQMTMAPGAHSVGAQFTPDDQTLFQSSTAPTASLTVTKEDASIGYASDNPTAMQVSTSGGGLAANALVLELTVKELEPDVAASPGTTGIGSNIGSASLAVSLVPIGPGSIYALTCTATGVSGTGYATARSFTCRNPAALPVNVYAVQATLSSSYYQAVQYDDVLTVYDPVAGFATGGGTFHIDGDLVRFGVNMKYKTNGKGEISATQGSVFAVRHHANGRKSRMESTSLSSAIAVGEDPTVPMGWAVIAGKANYTSWNATTSSYETQGGQAFTVYVEDRGEPGAGKDRVWMGGPGTLKLPGTLATAAANAVTLDGGNVAVPHRSP